LPDTGRIQDVAQLAAGARVHRVGQVEGPVAVEVDQSGAQALKFDGGREGRGGSQPQVVVRHQAKYRPARRAHVAVVVQAGAVVTIHLVALNAHQHVGEAIAVDVA
nr:hypothetical protein [Tanacetum cinerariifolium]